MDKRAIQIERYDNRFLYKKYKKFDDMVSDSTLQPTFKKVSLARFWCTIKEKYSQLSEKD